MRDVQSHRAGAARPPRDAGRTDRQRSARRRSRNRRDDAVFQVALAALSVPTGVSMFVIELIYKADLDRIDAHMKAHVAFLDKYYAAGNFLVSGRKIPRDGGIILAVGESKSRIQSIVEEDPFVARRLAEYRIIEFRASQRASDIQDRIEKPSS